jgi:hypothetical protein
MVEWFNSLEPILKVYWGIALIASLIFAIQMIISFIGSDVFDDMNVDTDSGGDESGVSHFFSVRNLVNFLLGAGWGGVCFYNSVSSKSVVTFLAILTGLFFVLIFFGLIKLLLGLQKNNTFRIEETVDGKGEVYLIIPAGKSGKGKIQISVRGSVHEISAVTDGEKLPTGTVVNVKGIVDKQTVLVESI